jgi:HEAT repeat protein
MTVLPQLLFALRAGHTANRGRIVRLLESLDDETLQTGPVAETLRDLLQGDDVDLTRRVGALISRRALGAFATDLVALLRDDPRRLEASRWLRRRGFPRPVARLVELVGDEAAPLPARAAAADLLKGQALTPQQRAALLRGLAVVELHAPVMVALGPVDEALVEAAVAANRAFAEAVRRRRREALTGEPEASWWERWRLPGPTALGVCADTRVAQVAFVTGVARLAIRARSKRWLVELVPHLFSAGLTRELIEAVVELQLTEFVRRLLKSPVAWATPAARCVTFELAGRLGEHGAARRLAKHLPANGKLADPDPQEALLALARLGRARAIAPLLDGALAGVRRELGQDPGRALGHRSLWGVAFRAGAALGDERFAQLGLEVLAAEVDVPAIDEVLAEVLTRLDPLELRPMLDETLRSASARHAARDAALEVVRQRELHELLPRVVALAGREPALADAATRVVADLLQADDAELVLELLRGAEPGDAALSKLLDCALDRFTAERAQAFARELLRQGAGGARAQARALRFLAAGQEELTQLRTCLELFRSPHAAVRTEALCEALRLGLLTAVDDPRAEAREDSAWGLLELAADALLEAHESTHARRQLVALFDQLLPAAGQGGLLESDQAQGLRQRLLQAGLWQEAATFHHAHRELLDLGEAGVEVGPLHGALLLCVARATFRHPVTGGQGRYPGPLPRFERTFSLASPWVQEALFEVVRGPAYLRTTALTARFCASSRPRVRREALGLLDREACLAHAQVVLGCLDDPDVSVRSAALELLRRHELSRFAARLRPALDDGEERVRLLAARALAEWGDQSCLARLVEFLASDRAALRKEAVSYLRRFEPALLVGLLAAHVRLEAPRAAAAVLAALRPQRLPEDEELLDAIFLVAAKGRGPLRARALRFLPDLVGARRLGDCVSLLADADPQVRQAAGYVLRRRDGRRHAPAIADLAASSGDPELRLEALALLGDLGVAEAARGLAPLLTDDDARVRLAARRALSAARGFSLQPELERALTAGLEGQAGPVALAELVAFLDRVGDDEAFTAIRQALRCEDRAVWEAVLAAARTRGREDHVPRLVELLGAATALPASLATLALAEVARVRHHSAREAVEELARESMHETVRRRALVTVRALEGESGEGTAALATDVARAAVRRLKTLEKEAKGGHDRRRAIWQTRGTLTACASLVAAEGVRTRELARAVKALPAEAWRGQSPWRLRDGVAAELQAVSGADVGAPLGVLPKPLRDHGRAAVVRRLRDRVSARTYLRHLVGHVPPALRDPRELTVVELAAERPLRLDDLRARWKQAPDRPSRERYEDLLVAVAQHWRPEAGALLADMIREAARFVRGLADDRWGSKDRQAQALAGRYARCMLRLGRVEQVDDLLELGKTDHDLVHRTLAALGEAGQLAERLPALAGESTLATRVAVLRLLGEAGGAEAARLLSERTEASQSVERAAVAEGLGLTGEPSAADSLGRLLEDDAPEVRAAAVTAAARLRALEHEGAIVAALAHDDPAVALAAVEAVRALQIEAAADALVSAVGGSAGRSLGSGVLITQFWGDESELLAALQEETGLRAAALSQAVRSKQVIPTRDAEAAERLRRRAGQLDARAQVATEEQLRGVLFAVPRAAAEALVGLAGPAQAGGLLRALREAGDDAVAEAVARALVRVLPAERLDEVGVLLGAGSSRVHAAALRVLGARRHLPALDAVRRLLAHDATRIRVAACVAAGDMGSAQLLPSLSERLDPRVEPDPAVRSAALMALAALGGVGPELRQRLLDALTPSHPVEVRLAATRCLAAATSEEAASGALLELLRAEVWPGLSLPEPGEPLEAVRERWLALEGARSRLRASGRALVGAALCALVDLDAGETLERGFELVWLGLTGGRWPNPDLFEPFLDWARAVPPEQAIPRLRELVVGCPQRHLKLLAALELVRLDPLEALPLFDAQPADAFGHHGDARGMRARIQALGAGLAAGREGCRARLRLALLDESAIVRREARAALEPARRHALTWEGSE